MEMELIGANSVHHGSLEENRRMDCGVFEFISA